MDIHPAVDRLKELLDRNNIQYDCFEHEAVRTSEEASKIRPGYTLKQGAKALVIKLNLRGGAEKFVMLVIPGDAKFDGKKVKKLFNAKDLRFATESEVGETTGGVLVGGVPPFGSLFGLQTYMDTQVGQNEKIVFNAGDRRVSVALKALDYVAVENPIQVSIV